MTSTEPPDDERSRRERNPRGQGDRLRLDLLAAAAELIGEAGTVEGVTLRSVAARAGVSPTAVYRHFADHDDLLSEALTWCWVDFERRLVEAIESAGGPEARFRAMADAYVAFATSEAGRYEAMLARSIVPGPTVSAIRSRVFGRLVDVVAAILEARGDDRDPIFVAGLVQSWMHGIVGLVRDGPDSRWAPISVLVDEVAFNLRLRDRPS